MTLLSIAKPVLLVLLICVALVITFLTMPFLIDCQLAKDNQLSVFDAENEEHDDHNNVNLSE